MRTIYNFSAGPAMLPEAVLHQAQAEMLDWHGTGMSIMEIGHRGDHFKEVAEQAEVDLRVLMAIPSHYHVLFVAGGASTQFAMVPLNLFGEHKMADYVDTGIWSQKAIAEAKRYGNVHLASQLAEKEKLMYIPPQFSWDLSEQAAYVHYTPNETISGVEFQWVPKTGDIPLVADMTSMILSREINVNDYGIIYAGFQKNIGQAGMTVVIIRDDLIHAPLPFTPTLYSYQTHAEHRSFYNTPPTYCWYIAGLVLAWMRREGGVSVFAKRNQRKASRLYQFLDQHTDFYVTHVHPECRSWMNIVFDLRDKNLRDAFLQEAEKANLFNLRGHRLLGGIRASIYNAMPEAGMEKLIQFMDDFAQKSG